MTKTSDTIFPEPITNNAIFLFFLTLFVFALIYISNKLGRNEKKCEIIESNRNNDINVFYNLNDLISANYFTGTIKVNNDSIDYDYKLKDFYIKTAYNCFCNGNFKNGHVNVCALENCAAQGVRALDMQVFSKNNTPIVACSSANQNTIKESFNEIALEDALSNIYNTYFIEPQFVNGATNNMKNDPLFLILRLHYGNMNVINDKNEKMTMKQKQMVFYNQIYNALTSSFEPSKFASREFDTLYGADYEKADIIPNMDMKDTKGKIFIFVIINNEPNYNNVKESNLHKIVDLYGDNLYNYRFNEIYDDSDSVYNVNKYKSQESLTYCMPTWSSYDNNYDFVQAFKQGTQFVGMNFQNNDTYLHHYNDFFMSQIGSSSETNITSSYIKKPDHMIKVPLNIRL
jgi:hypothetical protein